MNRKRKLLILSIKAIIISLLFGMTSTAYFGFNWVAQSPAEMACDLITATVFMIGVYAMKVANSIK